MRTGLAGFLGALLCTSALAQDESTLIRDHLKRMQAGQAQVAARLENFGYIETSVLEQGKKVERETYSVTFYKDRRVRRLTEKNGKPLTGGTLEKEERRVEKLITQLEKGKAPELDNRRIRLEDFIAAADFSNIQTVGLQGRKLVSCAFAGRKGYKPANVNQRFVQNLTGTLLLDPEAMQVVRAEFTLVKDFKVAGGLFFNMKRGTHFVEEDTWFSEVWLPKSREMTMKASAMIGYKLNLHSIVTFGDYRRFVVSAHENAP